MSVTELMEKLRALPKEKRAEVFDFIDYLVGRFGGGNDSPWTDKEFAEFSLGQAIRGMEDDPVTYSSADIREPWQ